MKCNAIKYSDGMNTWKYGGIGKLIGCDNTAAIELDISGVWGWRQLIDEDRHDVEWVFETRYLCIDCFTEKMIGVIAPHSFEEEDEDEEDEEEHLNNDQLMAILRAGGK